MKRNALIFIVLLVFLISCTKNPEYPPAPAPVPGFEDMSGNPVFTSIFTADPSAHVWPGEPDRIYVYPSHDVFPSRGCDLMDKYHVFSSTNMVDWIDEGEILSADDVSWGREEGGFMWAPDCAYKDGKYYFYFPHPTGSGDEWNSTWKIGVAVSDKPASGFTDMGMLTMDGKPVGGNGFIDPCVFGDDDGAYYIAAGGGGRCFIGRMGEDMLSIDGKLENVSSQLPYYHEGAWLFKRNGIYYLMYPGKVNPSDGGDSMLYAVSGKPTGPWEYKGVILDPVAYCDTSHGSVVEFKDKWYLFYHNAEISGSGTLRSVCVEELFWNEDGTIQKIEQTETGVKAVGDRIPFGTAGLEAKYYDIINEDYAEYSEKTSYTPNDSNCEVNGAVIENGTVHNLHIEGAYAEFSGIDGGRGGRALLTVVYAAADGASAKIDSGGDPDGDGYFLKLPETGGWDDYTGSACRLIDLKPGGDNIIRLTGGMGGFNIEEITVSLIP